MDKHKVIIIDDNRANIKELRKELARFDNLCVVGDATHRQQAIKLVKHENPNIVFLDVELAHDGITGFELLEELKALKIADFAVVFYTAYKKYAIDAIRASAFDYLLKPIDPIQLSGIISRILANPVFETNIHVEKLIDQLCCSPKIALQTVMGIRLVKQQSIVFAQVETNGKIKGGNVLVYLINGDKIKLSGNLTLCRLLERIDSSDFFKISRQAAININYLCEIDNSPGNVCRMTQPYQKIDLKVSRNQMQALRRKFSLS